MGNGLQSLVKIRYTLAAAKKNSFHFQIPSKNSDPSKTFSSFLIFLLDDFRARDYKQTNVFRKQFIF